MNNNHWVLFVLLPRLQMKAGPNHEGYVMMELNSLNKNGFDKKEGQEILDRLIYSCNKFREYHEESESMNLVQQYQELILALRVTKMMTIKCK